MTRSYRAACGALFMLLGLASNALAAPPSNAAALKILQRIAGPDGNWDYASFDSARRRVYVAHGDDVVALDVDTGRLDPSFAKGSHLHAVVPIPDRDELLTTNGGDGSVRILNASTGELIKSLSVDSPDAVIYDPVTQLAIAVNGDAGTLTLIDVPGRKVVGKITVGTKLEYPAADGKGLLYVNEEEKGSIAVVDLAQRKVVSTFLMKNCEAPTGLALVEGGRLVSACANKVTKILNASDGKELASVRTGAHPDAVIYDRQRAVAYVPAALEGTLTVIALSGPANNKRIGDVWTRVGTRTGTLDPTTGRLYLPSGEYNLPIPPLPGTRPTVVPGSFQILVLARQ